MKTLLILRHAKSSWKHPELADHDRPLSKRGKQDAPRVGDYLQKAHLEPDLILSSTALRARDTAEIVAQACGYPGEITYLSEFYLAGSEEYMDALCQAPDEAQIVMIVGHNPGLEELLAELTETGEHLPTAALAQVELPVESWSALQGMIQGQLVQLWLPRIHSD